MAARSGGRAAPILLGNIRLLPPRPEFSVDVEASVDDLLRAADESQERRFAEEADDAEGFELSSRPHSPCSGDERSDGEDGDLACESRSASNCSASDPPLASNKGKRPREDDDGLSRDARRKLASKRKRSMARIAQAQQPHPSSSYAPKRSALERVRDPHPLKLGVNAKKLPKSEGSWIGKRVPSERSTPYGLDELTKDGFKIVHWDGRTARTIVDRKKRIIAALVGRPEDPTWDAAIADATAAMVEVEESSQECFPEKCLTHRRGEFAAFPVGVSFGGGQQKPGNLAHPKKQHRLWVKLKTNCGVIRIAGFHSSALAAFFPLFFQYLQRTMDALFSHHPELVRNFRNSVFPAITFNCGPRTVALRHTDFGNISHGICALTALGSYDYRLGGHLILFDLKIVVEFPPGSTVLIPSGCVSHGNTPIQDTETRMSITQYAAGGLFRWVAYGFQTASSLIQTSAGRELKEEIDIKGGERWRQGLAMFSKVQNLAADIQRVFNKSSNPAA